MGTYTEIYVNVDLKEDVPFDVINVLHAMSSDVHSSILDTKPRRWRWLFRNGSYYTPTTYCSILSFNETLKRYSFLGKGDIKNYEGEIEAFFGWLNPHIDAVPGEFIGYMRREDEKLPTLFTKE